MLDWMRERRRRVRRDQAEARHLIARHGDQAFEIVSARAERATLDARTRRRVARAVALQARN